MLLNRDAFSRLCRARALLAETGDAHLTVKDLAREVRISPFHFIRQFEALFGLTPHQYRIQSRLDRAKLLLAIERHRVTDVCMAVGFSSLGSFSDLFTRRIGAAPSAYRRRDPRDLFPGCLNLMAALPPDAFRNFQEASTPPRPLESDHANQAHQHHGG